MKRKTLKKLFGILIGWLKMSKTHEKKESPPERGISYVGPISFEIDDYIYISSDFFDIPKIDFLKYRNINLIIRENIISNSNFKGLISRKGILTNMFSYPIKNRLTQLRKFNV